MEVTRPLVFPNLPPCSGRNDLSTDRDGTCNPVQAKQVTDWSGWDCCKYYGDGGSWKNEVVRVNHVKPENFQYDKYRYQMYARPISHRECHGQNGQQQQQHLQQQQQQQHQVNNPRYIPATTDVRALQQTMYIPIVPSNPGGETEVTFPMTPRTMGQPDVTSACCVPVIPSQPGFKNLTNGILPGPCSQLNGHRGYPKPGDDCRNCFMKGSQPAPQTVTPLSNVPGGAFVGLTDTFPEVKNMNRSDRSMCSYAAQMSKTSTLTPPHYTGALPPGHNQPQYPRDATGGCHAMGEDMCFDRGQLDSGMPGAKECVNASVVRFNDRVQRKVTAHQETPDQKYKRMSETYGSFGSCLIQYPKCKRFVNKPADQLTEPGNGHHWDYPVHPNRQCYILERNPRC